MFRDGEERDVLDVGVVFWVVGHQVMDIVVLLMSSFRYTERG